MPICSIIKSFYIEFICIENHYDEAWKFPSSYAIYYLCRIHNKGNRLTELLITKQ